MQPRNLRRPLFALLWLCCVCPAWGAPPMWESDFGPALDFGGDPNCDDCEQGVTLSFSFPFQGQGFFTSVWVGTNGDLQLGSLGLDGAIDYDHWEYMEEFLSDQAPSIAINSDWDLTLAGSVHFNDFGDRAVFTWNEVGTHQEETHLSSFQIQLLDDGTIILGFNGILDGPGEDLLGSLDEGIVVGVSGGNVTPGHDAPLRDLNGGPFHSSATVFERWCFNQADSCGYGGVDLGWPGAPNSAFDLDQQNVYFRPNGDLAYYISPDGQAPPPSELFTPVPATSLRSLLMLAMGLVGTGWLFIRRKTRGQSKNSQFLL